MRREGRGEKKKREQSKRKEKAENKNEEKRHPKREAEAGRRRGGLGQEAGTRVGCPSRAAGR
jgi:hypothetical protein